MLLFIAVGAAVVALLALLAAIISTSSLLGWITVGVSAVGLVLLVVNEVRERAPYDTDEQDVGASPPPPPQEDIVVPTDEEPSIAAEPADNEEVLRPDIWPPGHPVQETISDGDRVDPRRDREGDALRPDIWP